MDYLFSATISNNWQNLPLVTNENNRYATKEPAVLSNVLQSAVSVLKNEAVAHGDLINDEKFYLPKELSCRLTG